MAFADDVINAERRARGAVFHHLSRKAGKTKFFVVLNRVWPPLDRGVVYAFATSNAEHFEKAEIPEDSIVRLAPGDYPFVKVPTVIDLTRPEIEELEALVRAPDFKFVTQLRPDHLEAIDDAVRVSRLISRRVKKMILPDYG